MKIIQDCFGREIRLTSERITHILEHPEMAGLLDQIEHTLQHPELVRRSRSDESVELFYRYYIKTIIGDKWLCIVVKYRKIDAFVITAYLTDRPKAGDDLWPIK